MEFIINGQSHYLAELFKRYKNELFGFYYRLNRDASTSEDLVQNVFVRILKYSKSYQATGKFRSWLYQLARNAQADLFRSKQQQFQAQFDSLDENQQAIETPDDQQRFDLLDRALYQLSSEQRELIILSRYQKLSYGEIAELLGSTEGAIKVRMFRSICQLRDLYLKLEREQA